MPGKTPGIAGKAALGGGRCSVKSCSAHGMRKTIVVTMARRLPTTCIATLIAASARIAAAGAAEAETLEPVLVVAPLGVTREPDRIPADAQQASADQIDRLQALDLTDFLNRSFGSININHAQNNPLQPDFNFRGFTASPLLGLPQGLSVYQNGVRVNEPFGDVVNWENWQLEVVDLASSTS
mgnify:CR=1 FL=1